MVRSANAKMRKGGCVWCKCVSALSFRFEVIQVLVCLSQARIDLIWAGILLLLTCYVFICGNVAISWKQNGNKLDFQLTIC